MTDNGALSNPGTGVMQGLIDILAALFIWAAAVLLAPFGVEVSSARPHGDSGPRAVERTAPPAPVAAPASGDCPKAVGDRLQAA